MSEKNQIHIEDSENTWANHKIYILAELKRLGESEIEFSEQLVDLKTEIATLRTKMAIYIGVAGFLSSAIVGVAVKLFT